MIQLRDYQKQAVETAVERIRAGKVVYLAMQPRTGKTLTALSIAARHHKYADANVLFLTKKKAISSIQKDYEAGEFKYSLTVTNFEQAGNLEPIYDLIIVDEAHSVGAYPKSTKRYKDIKRLTKGVHVIFLSGTPHPESFSQIFHQVQLSDYSPFKEYKNFYAWFKVFGIAAKTRISSGLEVNCYKATRPELQAILQELFIVMTQKEAGFTQTVDEKFHSVQMKAETKQLFKTLRKDLICYPTNENIVTADTPGKLLQKCHQIGSGTIIDDTGKYLVIDSSKANYLFSRFTGQKFAIFYVFKSELELIKRYADSFGIKLALTPEEFNSTNARCAYAAQVVSGREGVDLRAADCLIMFNIHHASTSYWQAIARLQYQKRDRPATIHWLFSDTGLENKIYKSVVAKKNYTSSVFRKDF